MGMSVTCNLEFYCSYIINYDEDETFLYTPMQSTYFHVILSIRKFLINLELQSLHSNFLTPIKHIKNAIILLLCDSSPVSMPTLLNCFSSVLAIPSSRFYYTYCPYPSL